MTSFAGALWTPRVSSLRAQMPPMCPDGGTNRAWPASGSKTLIQGQYSEASKPGTQSLSRNRGDRGGAGYEVRRGEVTESLVPGASPSTLQQEHQRRGQGEDQQQRVRENHGSRRSQVFSSAAPEQVRTSPRKSIQGNSS